MTDKDIIRKAVELADGWCWNWDGAFNADISNQMIFGRGAVDPQQWALDALAAQLVRQVDALHDGWLFESYEDRATVIRFDLCGMPRQKWHESGTDRTMNTLRAIVESGVLDND